MAFRLEGLHSPKFAPLKAIPGLRVISNLPFEQARYIRTTVNALLGDGVPEEDRLNSTPVAIAAMFEVAVRDSDGDPVADATPEMIASQFSDRELGAIIEEITALLIGTEAPGKQKASPSRKSKRSGAG